MTDDLVRDAQARQLGLREWVKRRVYLLALVHGDGRYNMYGECVAPLSEEHRQLARDKLASMDRAREKRQRREATDARVKD